MKKLVLIPCIAFIMQQTKAQKPMIGCSASTVMEYLKSYAKSKNDLLIDNSSYDDKRNINMCGGFFDGGQLCYHVIYKPPYVDMCDWAVFNFITVKEGDALAQKFDEDKLFKKVDEKDIDQSLYSIKSEWLQTYKMPPVPTGEDLWSILKWERIDYVTFKVTLKKFNIKPKMQVTKR